MATALGAPLFYMTFGGVFFWKAYSYLGLPDHDLVHPILAGIGLVLMGFGLYRLYRELPRTVASKAGLALALLGVFLGIMAMIGRDLETPEILIVAVFALPPIGLAVIGVVALKNRSLGRLSFLPMGIAATFLGLVVTASSRPENLEAQVFFTHTYVGWVLLGVAIVLNQPEEKSGNKSFD